GIELKHGGGHRVRLAGRTSNRSAGMPVGWQVKVALGTDHLQRHPGAIRTGWPWQDGAVGKVDYRRAGPIHGNDPLAAIAELPGIFPHYNEVGPVAGGERGAVFSQEEILARG